MAIALTVNGVQHTVHADGETPLLYVLRNDLALKGARYGCGLGQCGACTVVIDGKAVPSCNVPLNAAAGKNVVTIEGIGDEAHPHPVQRALIDEQAAQCGYCMSGIVMSAYALFERNSRPDERELRAALNGNLCRCGSHARVLRALRLLAKGAA
mgnify:CR=1 FL=1